MNFFNETASNYLQFVTMVLEIVGITLAYIEIRYKPLAKRTENWILRLEDKIKDFAWKVVRNNMFSTLITLFVIVIFFFEVPYFAGFYDKILPAGMKSIQDIFYWLTFPIVLLFFLGLFVIFLSEFIAWLNRFSGGHAIGALGVVVTLVGLIGEVYQVLTIFYK
ncbi:MAG: hypothetical protein OEW75_03210 [Cyclobacteriaceae bacterium]|nr:hypothetical protein [Cyclobacteriaceae bacterium]